MEAKHQLGEEVEEYLSLKEKSTRAIYSSAFTKFLEFYHTKHGEDVRFMPISRSRAYQILQQIDPRIVRPHWFRPMRLSHLAESLDPYQLNEQIGFWEKIDSAVAYVHGRVSDFLEACEKARI